LLKRVSLGPFSRNPLPPEEANNGPAFAGAGSAIQSFAAGSENGPKAVGEFPMWH